MVKTNNSKISRGVPRYVAGGLVGAGLSLLLMPTTEMKVVFFIFFIIFPIYLKLKYGKIVKELEYSNSKVSAVSGKRWIWVLGVGVVSICIINFYIQNFLGFGMVGGVGAASLVAIAPFSIFYLLSRNKMSPKEKELSIRYMLLMLFFLVLRLIKYPKR